MSPQKEPGKKERTMRKIAQALSVAAKPIQDKERRWILVACSLAIFSTTMQFQPFNLGTSWTQFIIQLPITGLEVALPIMILSIVVCMLLFGALGDVFGHKRFFVLGLLGMLVANLVQIFFFTPDVYGISQVANLLAMTPVIPMSMAIIFYSYEKEMLPFAIGIYFALSGIGIAVSGLFWVIYSVTHNLNYVLVPTALIVGLTLFLAIWAVKPFPRRIVVLWRDLIWYIIWAMFIFFFIYTLIPFNGNWNLELLVIETIMMIALLLITKLIRKLNLQRFQISMYNLKNLTLSLGAGLLVMFVQVGVTYQARNFFLDVWGSNELNSSLFLAPFVICIVIAAPIAGKIALRFSKKILLIGGLLFVALGTFLFSTVTTTSTYPIFFILLGVLGMGAGIVNIARTSIVFTSFPDELPGMGAGYVTGSNQLGTSLGIAGFSLMISYFMEKSSVINTQMTQSESLVAGLHGTFLITSVILVAAAVVVWFGMKEDDKPLILAPSIPA